MVKRSLNSLNQKELQKQTIARNMHPRIEEKWVSGPKVLTTEITSSNPFIRVTEIKSADIILTKPKYKNGIYGFLQEQPAECLPQGNQLKTSLSTSNDFGLLKPSR